MCTLSTRANDTIRIVLILFLAYTPKAKLVVLIRLDRLVFHKLRQFLRIVVLHGGHPAHHYLSKCHLLRRHALCLRR